MALKAFFFLASFGQTASMDTIYFSDGNIIATKIFPGLEDSQRIFYQKSERHYLSSALKSDIYYIFTNGEYHLIGEYDPIKQLKINLFKYKKQATIGVLFLGAGVATIFSGAILNEHQMNKNHDAFNTYSVHDIPKYLNYSGLGMMFIGCIVTYKSFKFLERGSVDITPFGVRVNI